MILLRSQLLLMTSLVVCGFIMSCARTTPPMNPFPHAAPNPDATVISGKARFTILTPALIRMEWSPDGQFEDRPSFNFIRREVDVPDFTVSDSGAWLEIETRGLLLRYRKNSGVFNGDNLSVDVRAMPGAPAWRPGMEDDGNLGGTVRTLDRVSGAMPLEAGLLSRDGWALVDDSATLLFGEGDPAWVAPRHSADAIDWYFFGHGRNYKAALRDYTLVAGPIPLPPHFVFGSWWSRYWAYHDTELQELVGEFREHDVPLDVLVVDMDWHRDGWTGYTWNPRYFPEPEEFLRWCREQSLKVTLNLHPHDGVGKHEAVFEQMASAMGLNPPMVDRIPFRPSDPRYMKAYFEILHHPLERLGVDFWWIDWQQGDESEMPGLDPLFWLNYLHWEDMARQPERAGQRPLIFSRWGGLGNHRYQIGFSGDTFCDWESLAFQPYFTATAGNVAYPYWSHDIGGHQPGPVEGELYARWIQYAVFNPVLRTHTTKHDDAERRIWAFSPEVFRAAREAFHLRYALVPYIYGAARQCYDSALPLCRPLYYNWPERDEAYRFEGQYLFGDDLLAAPVVAPREEASRCAVSRVWLPPGQWRHWFTGELIEGPREVALMTPLDQVPVFARAGAIIPMVPPAQRLPEAYDHVILRVFAGESGDARLYEDDGETIGYQNGEFGVTRLALRRSQPAPEVNRYTLTIGATEGEWNGRPAQRRWEVRLLDVWPAAGVWVNDRDVARAGGGSAAPGESAWHYDVRDCAVVVSLADAPTTQAHTIIIDVPTLHENVLRSGWRGRLAMLHDLTDRFGDAAPFAARELLDAAVRSPESSAVEAEARWQELALQFALAPAPPELQHEALMRMLSLTATFRLEGTEDGGMRALTEVAALRAVNGLSARFQIQSPDGWTLERAPSDERRPIAMDAPARFDAKFRPTAALHAASLPAMLTLHWRERTFDVPLSRTVLASINAWRVIGPFDNPPEAGLDTPFPPEEELNFEAVYSGKSDEPVRWITARREITPGTALDEEFFVDFNEIFDEEIEDAVAYAVVFLHAPEEIEAVLAFGSDDGAAVWLNGEEIFKEDIGRPYISRQDRVKVKVRAGVNTLMFKIKQLGHDWGFAAHIETPDGRPEPRIKATLNP